MGNKCLCCIKIVWCIVVYYGVAVMIWNERYQLIIISSIVENLRFVPIGVLG